MSIFVLIYTHNSIKTQIHQGFSSTAEAFARTAGQDIDEDITSIQNRQAIQKLVLAGRMGDAIAMTNRLYPGFLQRHPSLHFMLKVTIINNRPADV